MELDNPRLELRPGMSGVMRIDIAVADALTVPNEAVIDSGESQYVFVARGAGLVEPRNVRVGASDGERVQILDGLSEGEAVVTAGNFLLDSESRLRAAIETLGAQKDGEQGALAQHP
jgi:multidrug efflux pump subunit AcrA (membrane-fusion protein)